MSDEQRPAWKLAITLEPTATSEQRRRNSAFHQRLRDGVPGDYRQPGLKGFVFADVPMSSCTIDSRGGLTFRLDPNGECYHRLLSTIIEHTDASCDADAEVARLAVERDAYRAMLCDLLASAHPHPVEHPTMTKQWARARALLKDGPAALVEPALAEGQGEP